MLVHAAAKEKLLRAWRLPASLVVRGGKAAMTGKI